MHETAPTRPRLVLAMLLLVYTFNFVDRQILGILALEVKRDLDLSDTQLGLLGGIAFAALYSTLAIPLGVLADRTKRTWVIAGSLAVWSGFTALCGTATSFAQLFLYRLGVGVGEAGGVAPSYAVIADIYPAQQRGRAMAIYSLGIPFGSALGVLFGGYVAATVDWRSAFIAVGLAGVVVAPLFWWLAPEPVRPRAAPGAAGESSSLLAQTFRTLSRKRSFWLLSLGAASSSMLGYGLAFWLPALMQRSFGLNLIETSRFYGAILLLGGVVGVLAGGILGDRLGKGDRAAYARIPAVAFFLAVPLFAGGILSNHWLWAFLLFLVPQALAYMWLAPIITAVQHLVPANMRATASASFLMINNLIGIGGGTFALGALSTSLTPRFGEEALRYSMLIGLVLYLLAGTLMWAGSRSLRGDWTDEAAE